MQLFGGTLSDRFGRKRLIVYPSFIFPVLYFMAAYSKSWYILVFVLVIANSLSAFQLPSLYAMIAESVPKIKRAKAYSIFELFVVLGITVGPAIGMLMISRLDIRYMFFLSALITLLTAISRTIWLNETHHQRIKINKKDSFKKLFNKKMLLIVGALSSLFLLFNLTANGPFIALYANEIMDYSKANINLIFALGGFAAVIYSIWGGKLIEKWGSKIVLSCSALGMGIFSILWSLSLSQFLIISLFIVLYVFFQSCYIAYGSLLADITHRESRGLIIGFIGTSTGLIGSIGPFLGGLLRLYFGPQSTFWAGLFFAFFTAFILNKVKD
jgi:MFS family permease